MLRCDVPRWRSTANKNRIKRQVRQHNLETKIIEGTKTNIPSCSLHRRGRPNETSFLTFYLFMHHVSATPSPRPPSNPASRRPPYSQTLCAYRTDFFVSLSNYVMTQNCDILIILAPSSAVVGCQISAATVRRFEPWHDATTSWWQYSPPRVGSLPRVSLQHICSPDPVVICAAAQLEEMQITYKAPLRLVRMSIDIVAKRVVSVSTRR